MKKTAKTLICTGIVAAFLSTTGIYTVDYTKKWVNNKVQTAITQYEQQDRQQTKQDLNQYEQKDKEWTNKKLDETITQYSQKDKQTAEKTIKEGIEKYDQKDRQWTNKKLTESITQYGKENKASTEKIVKEEINKYEQKDKDWTKQTFETQLPLEQIAKASDSAYMIIHWASFKTATGELIETPLGTGSGILLKGGYFLTAKHVVEPNIPTVINNPLYGTIEYCHSEFSLTNEKITENLIKKEGIEKIISGYKPKLDYSLLKLKDCTNTKLPLYANGLNVPSKIKPGMKTITIGYPLRLGKNLRLGNITQTNSDQGEHSLTYNNDILPSDSGGPLFIIEDGSIKLTALSTETATIPIGFTVQISNINYGVKISSVITDIEEQLKSGKLDKKTAEEVENFLKLNK